MTTARLAIVGGGASGTLLALQLLRRARTGLEVLLFEPRTRLGRGLAYDTPHLEHLLNVPQARMSALPEEPDHFARWLERAAGGPVAAGFVPRQLYGLYLQETLDAARAAAAPGVVLTHVPSAVESVVPMGRGACLRVAGAADAVPCERVAIALGNLPGLGPMPELAGHHLYVSDPWAPEALEQIRPNESVLLAGTGLTMVDVALTLTSGASRAPILAVSRHGLLPQAHAPRAAPPSGAASAFTTAPAQVRAWLRAMREAYAHGADWRALFDELRPLVPQLWRRLAPRERARFLRHLRPYWETRRHRLAPEVAQAVARLVRKGGLDVRAGRLLSATPVGPQLEVTIDPRGDGPLHRLRVDRLINATGAETDVTRARSPLLQQLLRDGVARPDPLRLGLDVTSAGRLLDRSGIVSDVFFTLGPLRRGERWETTAVPEIRQQAAEIADLWTVSPPAVAEASEPRVSGVRSRA